MPLSGLRWPKGHLPLHDLTPLVGRIVPTVGEGILQTINVRQLKTNPSAALNEARSGIVLVTSRDEPKAVLIGFE